MRKHFLLGLTAVAAMCLFSCNKENVTPSGNAQTITFTALTTDTKTQQQGASRNFRIKPGHIDALDERAVLHTDYVDAGRMQVMLKIIIFAFK